MSGSATATRQGITIRDVARAANVSISTVSHVLSGKRPTSGQTRRRVQEVIQALNYRPNRVAQSLVWRRPFALGLIIPDITNPYFPTFARGVEDRVREHGYTLVLGNSAYDPDRESSYLELVRSNQLAGAICCLGDETSPILPELLRAIDDGLAVVLVHSPMPRVPTVCADNRQGGRLAAEHLLALGHRAIGIVGALPVDEGMADREGGFLDALRDAGRPWDRRAVPVDYGDHQIEGGREATLTLLQRAPGLTAIFVLNDLMALGALVGARALGRRVPEEVSIVGFDDIPYAALADPPLTTVGQPIRQLGEHAADLLLRVIDHGAGGAQREPPRVLLPNQLISRGSCGPAPT
ncbi:MAG: LacI family transcriptional regulator [Chloroflexota bacterium]|nr:LacI family transcriptional regulator [Chloroflexota bacterium]